MAKTPVKTASSPAPKPAAPPSGTTLASNRKASYEYEIVERYEAGVVLSGTEIKSIRAGKADIGDALRAPRCGRGSPHRHAHRRVARCCQSEPRAEAGAAPLAP